MPVTSMQTETELVKGTIDFDKIKENFDVEIQKDDLKNSSKYESKSNLFY